MNENAIAFWTDLGIVVDGSIDTTSWRFIFLVISTLAVGLVFAMTSGEGSAKFSDVFLASALYGLAGAVIGFCTAASILIVVTTVSILIPCAGLAALVTIFGLVGAFTKRWSRT